MGALCTRPQTEDTTPPRPANLKVTKMVVVGDSSVGKSSLIRKYFKDEFDENDDKSAELDCQTKGISRLYHDEWTTFQLEVYDTSADEKLSKQRQRIYKNTDLFIICVSSVSRDSLKSIAKWKAEIRTVEQDAPIVLVITK